jgi:tetratricopeptide (TPR) repeat protein
MWYGDTSLRSAVVALGDTMYRAGAADVAVLPDLAKLTVDRSHGPLIRASAAEFAGQLIAQSGAAHHVSPAIVNSLIGAANDSEAWVRIAAVRTLGTLPEQPRVMSALAAHLADPSRLARVAAAEALLHKGVATIEGPAGVALAQAQTEWAESLRTFNDDPRDQTTLGWLESARGRSEAAEQALNAAIRLDPTAPRPHVLLGVVLARGSRFDEALQHFRTARTTDPSYPNIDRLIEEAQKRREPSRR